MPRMRCRTTWRPTPASIPIWPKTTTLFGSVIAKDIAAPLQLVVDNMTELEHTGMVHKQLAFGIDDFDTVETRCQHDDDSVTIFYQGRQRPLPPYLSLLMGLRRGDVYVQTASVSFTPPCASYRISWTMGPGGSATAVRPSLRQLLHRGRRRIARASSHSSTGRPRGRGCTPCRALALPLFRRLVSAELERDKAIIEKVPQSEATLEWFQLSRFDGPLVATRKLMERHYASTGDDLRVTCDPETVGVGGPVARGLVQGTTRQNEEAL